MCDTMVINHVDLVPANRSINNFPYDDNRTNKNALATLTLPVYRNRLVLPQLC